MAPVAETAQLPYLERLGYEPSPPPFVNSLLKEQSIFLFSQDEFSHLINQIDARTPKFLAVQMDRQIDTTGLVANFIERCDSPEAVQTELDAIAYQVLSDLKQEPESLQKQVAKLLSVRTDEDTHVDHTGFLWLDRQYGKIITELGNQRTPKAEMYRQRTMEAIQSSKDTDVLYIPKYSMFPLPKYWYDNNCHVVHIDRHVHIPQLPEENRQILEQLTPRLFKRQEQIPDLDPLSQIGFMKQFGKLGDPLARTLAETLEEQFKLQKFAEKNIYFAR